MGLHAECMVRAQHRTRGWSLAKRGINGNTGYLESGAH
jgi:hypothetical protein